MCVLTGWRIRFLLLQFLTSSGGCVEKSDKGRGSGDRVCGVARTKAVTCKEVDSVPASARGRSREEGLALLEQYGVFGSRPGAWINCDNGRGSGDQDCGVARPKAMTGTEGDSVPALARGRSREQ